MSLITQTIEDVERLKEVKQEDCMLINFPYKELIYPKELYNVKLISRLSFLLSNLSFSTFK